MDNKVNSEITEIVHWHSWHTNSSRVSYTMSNGPAIMSHWSIEAMYSQVLHMAREYAKVILMTYFSESVQLACCDSSNNEWSELPQFWRTQADRYEWCHDFLNEQILCEDAFYINILTKYLKVFRKLFQKNEYISSCIGIHAHMHTQPRQTVLRQR